MVKFPSTDSSSGPQLPSSLLKSESCDCQTNSTPPTAKHTFTEFLQTPKSAFQPIDTSCAPTVFLIGSFAIVQQPMAAMRCSSTTGPSSGKTRPAQHAGNKVPPSDSSPTVQTATSTMLIGGTTCAAQTIPINVQPHPTSGMNSTRAWRALTLSATIAVPAKISPKLPETSEGVPGGILKSSLVSITNGPEIALRR